MIRSIAMYLPQFHEVPENNMWWGDGYTEWTAVKAGKPLFPEHDQPKKPLNGNYYDLMERKTLSEQAKLAQEYGIYGFCFYHYWFEKGKKILEKPAEKLLMWKDIDIPFCFCWANQTWARTWSKVQGANEWTSIYEKNVNSIGSELLRQRYGREEEWKKHFNYLLPFFMDKRYIKIDNKPVIVIYRADEILCLSQMLKCWNDKAIRAGLAGIYVIGEMCTKDKAVNAVMEHQMFTAWHRLHSQMEMCSGIRTWNYEKIWINIINSADPKTEKDVFYMGFTGYDDTPRHGDKGWVAKGVSPHIFEKYFSMLVKKSLLRGNEYVFLNAWNEWGEGMYLEPDEKNGYAFLESHKRAISGVNVAGQEIKVVKVNEESNDLPEKKIYRYYKLLNDWMRLRGEGKRLADFLVENKYNNVAIYGMGDLGRHLLQELDDSQIEVKYFIDKRDMESLIPVLSKEDKWPQVDAIIVTPFLEFEDILEDIEKKIQCSVLSIEEILSEID